MSKKKAKKEKEQEEIYSQYNEQYKNSVEQSKNKSQDDFEKYINLWASGGLVVSLFVIDKIIDKQINIKHHEIFIIGISCFVITLSVNLLSHKMSIKVADYILEEMSKDTEIIYEESFQKELSKRNSKIDTLNNISIIILIIAIISILIFFIVHFLNF